MNTEKNIKRQWHDKGCKKNLFTKAKEYQNIYNPLEYVALIIPLAISNLPFQV